MRTILLIILLLLTTLVNAQENPEIMLKNTRQFKLESDLFKDEPFTIQVCIPKAYDNLKEYPVVYLLDADKSIGMTKDIADWLMFGKEIQDIIIVGISYNKDDETWWQIGQEIISPQLILLVILAKCGQRQVGRIGF